MNARTRQIRFFEEPSLTVLKIQILFITFTVYITLLKHYILLKYLKTSFLLKSDTKKWPNDSGNTGFANYNSPVSFTRRFQDVCERVFDYLLLLFAVFRSLSPLVRVFRNENASSNDKSVARASAQPSEARRHVFIRISVGETSSVVRIDAIHIFREEFQSSVLGKFASWKFTYVLTRNGGFPRDKLVWSFILICNVEEIRFG